MARTARVGKLCKRKGTPHIGPDGENNKAKHRRLNQTHSRHRGREEFCRYYRAQLGLSEAEFSEFMGQVSCTVLEAIHFLSQTSYGMSVC